MKSVQIRSFFWSVFSCIRTDGVNLRIQSEYRKIWTRNNSVFGQFSRSANVDKSYHKSVRLLTNFPKIFEKCMNSKFSGYFVIIFLKIKCGFSNGYNSEDFFLTTVKTFKKVIDDGKKYDALPTYLCKAFDSLAHDLVNAKLHACGCTIESLKLINLFNQTQTKR